MNLYLLKSYLKFSLKSTNEHGVHSPFVYDLLINCFYDKSEYDDYNKIEKFRSNLYSSNEIIEVEDFGAGSKKFTSNRRKVSEMAKVAGSSIKESKLLYRIAKYFNSQSILELGTSLGISSYTFSLTSKNTRVTTVEGSKSIFEFNRDNFKNYKQNIDFKNYLFNKYLETIEEDKKFDLIFIDGNHTYEATIRYFETLKNHIHNGSVIIFDDIHWSKGMNNAWKEIIKDEMVSATIDTFYFGMVFFRKELSKEHFTVKTWNLIPKSRFRGI